jgi:hypothetical protein
MSKKSQQRFLTAIAMLAIVTGGFMTAMAAQGQLAEEEPPSEIEVPTGLTAKEELGETAVDVEVPDAVDGQEELNPVDEDGLEELTRKYSQTAKIFRKYAFLPFCTTTSCPGGIDHLAAGTGTRNAGFGTIRFRGTPPGATPVSAFLYWATIAATVTPPPPTQAANFNGNPVTGFLVGVGPNPCWGFGASNTYAYRAPVLPFILPGINGDYSVSGLPTNLTNGQNPWNPVSTTLPLSEGASLVVLYTHPSVPQGTFTQIHHPIAAIGPTGPSFGVLSFTHFLNLPIQIAAMKHTRLGADGQVGGGLVNFVATTTEQTFLAGPLPAAFTQIRGTGAYPSGSQDSDWNGHDGEPLNQLWDTHTMSIPGVIAPGPFTTNYRVQYNAFNDCIVPVAHVITAQ